MKNRALKMLFRITSVLIALIRSLPSVYSQAAVSCGKCGDDLYWSFSDYTLTISGRGKMYNFTQRTSQNNPTEMPWRALNNSISRVVIEDGVESIGAYAFYNFETISEIRFRSNSLNEIGEYAFKNCEGLVRVTLPDSVRTIGRSAFSNCDNLKEIRFGKGLEYIPQYICASDSSLVSVYIPEECKGILAGAFSGCVSLKDVDLSRFERIESISFMGTALTEAHFGKQFKYMQSSAFSGCSKLSVVTFEEGTCPVQISNSFLDGTAYYDALPKGLYTMFDGKVLMCKGVYTKRTLNVPEGVEIISEFCFDEAPDLRTVNLPSSLKKISDFAFRDCPKLTSVFVPPNVEVIGESALGIYTYDLGHYTEMEDFTISGKGLGAAAEYADRHNFHYTCEHLLETKFISGDCTSGGLKATVCVYCGACTDMNNVKPSSTHFFKTTTHAPTCTEEGYSLKKCSVCGKEERTVTSPAYGHISDGVWELVSVPDCYNNGCAATYCARCGDVAESIEIEKSEHRPARDLTTLKAVSCTESGIKVLLCTECGEELARFEEPAKGHVPSAVRTVVTLPSEDGSLCGCSVLLCRSCSTVLDMKWSALIGDVSDADAAAKSTLGTLERMITCDTDIPDVISIDFSSDSEFNVKDILCLRKLSGR